MAAPDMNQTLRDQPTEPQPPIILMKAREESAQRLMMGYALVGLFLMLLPGTFLGAWNLIATSQRHGPSISAAWIQAHGHAQIFGWIGTFILGIGFYSIPKMTGGRMQAAYHGWLALLLWGSGVLLRWATGVYQWHWRTMVPFSAVLELCAFLIFLRSVSRHRPNTPQGKARPPVWVVSVLVGTFGFGIGLAMNLGAAIYV